MLFLQCAAKSFRTVVMRKSILAFYLLFLSVAVYSQNVFLGSWHGKLVAGQMELTVVINLSQDEGGGLECTMDSPDQGVRGIKAQASVAGGVALEVTVPSLGAKYKGMPVAGKMVGTFTQMGQEFPLTLTKGEESIRRPQTPVGPFPYSEEEVVFYNRRAGAGFAGSLVIPDNMSANAPVVIMITGSGLEDRNEEIYDHKPFLVIADWLARNGVASLRYDDRNFGRSNGGDVKNATTLDFLEDAQAGVAFLESRGFGGRIGALGHSEGANIALMLGARGEVEFVVSLAGVGVKGDEALCAQSNRILELQGMDMRYSPEDFRETVASQGNPWLNWFIDYDPVPDIRGCKCPVFAVNGDRDTQVIASLNLVSIRANLPASESNFIREYPELNHLFQHCRTGVPTEYRSIEETFSTEVLTDLAAWLQTL